MKKEILCLIIPIFLSCNEMEMKVQSIKEEKNEESIIIMPISSEKQKELVLDKRIAIEEIITLEDIDGENAIVEINKVVYFIDKIFVLDKKFSSLNIYNLEGQYIQQIGEIGEGPGQYLNIDDFVIDKITKQVLILSNDQQKIHFFTTQGKYLKSSNIGFFSYQFANVDNERIYFTNFNPAEHNYNILITNKLGRLQSLSFPFNPDKENSGIAFSGFLNSFGKQILLSVPFSNSIYTYSKGKIISKYSFDFNSFGIPKEELHHFNKLFNNLINYSFLKHIAVESDKHLFYNFQHNSKINIGIYYKESGENYSFHRNSSESFLEKIISEPIGLMENFFITYIDLESYKYFKKKNIDYHFKFVADYPELVKKLEANEKAISPIILKIKIL